MCAQQKIILIEDDDSIRQITTMLLERIGGYEVVGFASGVEALGAKNLEDAQFALVDVMMPEMDGMETIRRLRAEGGLAHVPFIMMTARVQSSDLSEYMNTPGVRGVIQKPFDPRTLMDDLRKLLSDKE